MSVAFAHYLGVHRMDFLWFSSIMNIAFCATIIIFGVLSEMIGRRFCFMVASALMFLGCLLLLLSHTLTWWLIAAAIIGVGIGSGSIVTRVVIADLYHNDAYGSKSTVFSTCGLLMIPPAPLLGAGCSVCWTLECIRSDHGLGADTVGFSLAYAGNGRGNYDWS